MKRIFMAFALAGLIMACNDSTTSTEPLVKSENTPKETPQSEFADAKYAEWGKQRLMQMQNGDIDAWMTQFADNAVYSWSAGDSLAGKQAIAGYWKDRRQHVIESISFSNDIWLPIKVNVPQKGPDAPGVWLISWYQVDVKYRNAEKLMFWVHTDMHFNEKDQVDRVIQYIDRAPINAALGKK
jgi:hypothetical protein